MSGFIYPIFGHWAWGPDGWLNAIPFWKTPFHDFAGSTVVHTIGGMIALAGAIVLGPRLGRTFKRDGGGPMPAHNLLIASVGAIILCKGLSKLRRAVFRLMSRNAENAADFFQLPSDRTVEIGFPVEL